MELGIVLFVALVWFAPIVVAQDMGKKRNRTGWPYGLLLGWLGVLILSLTSYLPSAAEIRLRELEAQQRLADFERFKQTRLEMGQ